MRFIWVGIASFVAVVQLLVVVPDAGAVSPNGLVISHVIAGETSYSNAEFVAIYNNSNQDIDMTGYCLWSGSYAAAAIACITAEANTTVYIKAKNYLTIASATFAANHAYTPDTSYVAANRITVGGDTVYIRDSLGGEIDRVTWGAGGLATNGTLQRLDGGGGVLVDTDTAADFTALSTLLFPANASYDVVTIVDVCPNISGVQQSMPAGYLADDVGNCQLDSCLNLPGLQIGVPQNFTSDSSGNCIEYDACSNVAGVQPEVPVNMQQQGNECYWDLPAIELTELLPNAEGSDTGNEFIEIYNPNDTAVDMTLYKLRIGVAGDKVVSFSVGTTMAPGEYRAFSDKALGFTLVNSASRVVLEGIDGVVYGDSLVYENPPDGESWAFFSDGWQFTNQPTPGGVNTLSIIEEASSDTTDAPAPCPAGKYRNPLTNRCRNIESDASVLASCDEGQYRNPDTGRCRKITTTTAVPCKDGQYRSEETNRCRNIITASTTKPCKDNQYRSEETGRCRNITATSVPESSFAVQPVKDTPMTFVGWWTLGGVGALALAYAGWEWRREVGAVIGRVASHFSGKR